MEKIGLTYRGTRTWMNPNVPVVWYAIEREDYIRAITRSAKSSITRYCRLSGG